MVGWLFGEGLPSVDLAHGDLAGGEQRLELHGCGFGAGQHGLCFNAALEFLMQAPDRVRGTDRLPLARRETREGEQPVASLLQAVGDGAAF